MEIRLLGTFTVRVENEPLRIESAHVRALLAVLLLAPGQRGSHEYVAQRLWPDAAWSAESVRSLCNKLRKQVPGVMPPRNLPKHCGLVVNPEHVDYLRFRDGLTAAKQMSGRDRVDAMRTALEEWRGVPLDDLPIFDLSRERKQLDKEHYFARVDYLQAMIEACEYANFPDQLRVALSYWPNDADLRELAQSAGTPAGSVSRLSVSGVRIVQATLQANSVRQSAREDHHVAAVLQQLPTHRPRIVGRADHLDTLSKLLLTDNASAARVVVAIGMPGVGKTELVRFWASSQRDAFPGGVLHADLNGFGPGEPADPGQILARMLGDLCVQPPTPTLDGMITAFRSATADKGVLVILDNARDSNQARPLLPGRGCAAVVTSRDRLESLLAREGAHSITVEPLSGGDAAELLAADLGESRVRQAGHYIAEIVDLVGRLPLALAVIAAKARAFPAEAIRGMLDGLRERKSRLDSLEHRSDDLNVRLALSYSRESLTPAADTLFQLLALHPGPTISGKALAMLAGDGSHRALRELVGAHLLDEPYFERFSFHDLIRDYAAELAESIDEPNRERATERVLDFLLHNTWACDKVLVPGRRLPVGEPCGVETVSPATQVEAMEWMDREYSTVTAAIRLADERGLDRYTWLLAMAVVTYQWRRGHFTDADRYLSLAAVAAERVTGNADQAMVYRMLAGSRRGLGDFSRAKGCQLRAIALSEADNDLTGLSYGRVGLAMLHRESGEPALAVEPFRRALDGFRALGDILGEADVLNGLGGVHLDLGDYDEALLCCTDALRLVEETTDLNSRASTLTTLGRIHTARGDYTLAAAVLDFAVSAYREMTRVSHEARTLIHLSEALLLDGRRTESRQALLRALELYEQDENGQGIAKVRALLELEKGSN